jgi:hypothetical protein
MYDGVLRLRLALLGKSQAGCGYDVGSLQIEAEERKVLRASMQGVSLMPLRRQTLGSVRLGSSNKIRHDY